jgi:hypothetical protein
VGVPRTSFFPGDCSKLLRKLCERFSYFHIIRVGKYNKATNKMYNRLVLRDESKPGPQHSPPVDHHRLVLLRVECQGSVCDTIFNSRMVYFQLLYLVGLIFILLCDPAIGRDPL